MTDAETNMSWRSLGAIASGGTVQSIVFGRGSQLVLATSAGLWQGAPGQWQQPATTAPVEWSAVIYAGQTLIVGGVSGEIAYSPDHGKTWYAAWSDETKHPITCFVVSPRFAHDGVLLAGTDGAGMLRSTDGGRRWHETTVGLSDFSVLALATTPCWSERELVFAAAGDGVYRSPNGGRAWKYLSDGLTDALVQTIAVSPRFAADATVFAGSESHGIYRSVDEGASWRQLAGTEHWGAINALWCAAVADDQPLVLVAGTGDGVVLRSSDGGEAWAPAATGLRPILALTGNAEHLYAGMDLDGLVTSIDTGVSWQPDLSLAAHPITRLGAGGTDQIVAFGPTAGAWCASEERRWRRLASLDGTGLLFALACPTGAPWLAATSSGVYLSEDAGSHWQHCLDPGALPATVIARGNIGSPQRWLGTSGGSIWHSADAGLHWQLVSSLPSEEPLVALAAIPYAADDPDTTMLIAATFDRATQRVVVWRFGNADTTWSRWLTDTADGSKVTICSTGVGVDGLLIANGSRLWHLNEHTWSCSELDGSPLVAVERIPGSAMVVAATARRLFVMPASTGHILHSSAFPPEGLVDIAFTSGNAGRAELTALTHGGALWLCSGFANSLPCGVVA